jgi:hypothetical protein
LPPLVAPAKLRFRVEQLIDEPDRRVAEHENPLAVEVLVGQAAAAADRLARLTTQQPAHRAVHVEHGPPELVRGRLERRFHVRDDRLDVGRVGVRDVDVADADDVAPILQRDPGLPLEALLEARMREPGRPAVVRP